MGRPSSLLCLLLLAGCEGVLTPLGTTPAPQEPNSKRLVCDDRKHPAATVLHRLTPAQYQHAITDIFQGKARPSGFYPQRYGASVTGYSTEEAINQIGEQGAGQLMKAADAVAIDVAAAMGELLPCASAASPGQPCLDSYFDSYARRAFRRTLTADERGALQRTFDDARAQDASFGDAVAVVTSVVLQSPQFLYVVDDAAGEGRALTGFELGSRLSFLLWDSVPDDELLALAESEQLTDPAVLSAQARRMFESPRADPALTRYFREWTQARALLSTDKDPTAFPFFDADYASSLGQSFDRFVLGQMRGGGTLRSLFTSTDAYVDERLAPSFGVAAPAPGQWMKVSVDGTRYAGLNTHPLLLASNAHPTASSFVFRGRMIQKRLLCTPMGDPPANALALFAAIPLPADPVAREVSAAVSANPTCAGCHRVLDPPGLALEHFDATGRYRERYLSDRPIDTAGTLVGVGDAPLSFGSPVDLAEQLAQAPEASACATAQLFRFTFSRLETPADGCALQAVGDALAASQGDLAQAVLAMTTTEAFTWRVDP
jgi:hypothetical protein